MTARIPDTNGWPEIKGNPISKVGVFPYSGRQISDQLEPDKIYMVYRPAEELADPECIESFKLVPLTDEHEMLGSDFTPAEQKGVQGVTGEEVYFEEPYLKSNIKVFSENLAELIENGKKELSIGYRCLYDVVSGIYNGQRYDAIQRKLRGNHLAVVMEGRAGPDVAVLDQFKFTFDSTELKMNPDEMKKEGDAPAAETLESLTAKVAAFGEMLSKLTANNKAAPAAGDVEPILDGDKPAVVPAATAAADDDDEDAGEVSETDEDKGESAVPNKAMDAKVKKLMKEVQDMKSHGVKGLLAEISKRDSLANRLSQHVGTFDHADKTLSEVAAYGVKKLSLNCEKGQEIPVLEGYFAGRGASPTVSIGLDSKQKSSQIDAYLNGSK